MVYRLLKVLLGILVWLNGGDCQERGPDGVLSSNIGLGIRVWGAGVHMESFGYPGPSPRDVAMTWRVLSFEQSPHPSTLRLDCYHIDIPKSRSGGCGDYVFKFVDKGVRKEYCGTVASFSLLTESQDVTFEFKSGAAGGGRLNCSVVSVPLTPDRQELTTTTAPPPTTPSYLMDGDLEVDSDEHGTHPGARSTTCPCGWSNKVSSRIVNGTEAGKNEYPFIAALVERDSLSQFCGAGVITAWHALTAAHCTINRLANNIPMALILGQHDMYEDDKTVGRRVIEIERTVQHSNYKKGNYLDDISLLILKEQIAFSARVGPICMPEPHMDLGKRNLKIIGWGAHHHTGYGSRLLMKADVRAVLAPECFHVYPNIRRDPPTHLCTYAPHKGVCFGDSGSPVAWRDPETNRYTLVGIASFVRVCGDTHPSVHTKVDAYLDWIQHYINVSKPKAMTCRKR